MIIKHPWPAALKTRGKHKCQRHEEDACFVWEMHMRDAEACVVWTHTCGLI